MSSQEVLRLLKRDYGIELRSASGRVDESVARSFVVHIARVRGIDPPRGLFDDANAARRRDSAGEGQTHNVEMYPTVEPAVRSGLLYKYCPPARVDVLAMRRIMLTNPRHFNDPFEGLPHYGTIDAYYMRVPDGLTPEQRLWWNRKQKELTLRLWSARERRQYLDSKVSEFVVLSLTEDPGSLLMWGHYAANHSGFIIGFASDQDILAGVSPHRQLARVRYSSERPSREVFEQLTREELLLTKSREWNYESEWRIIDSTGAGHAHQRPIHALHCWPFDYRPQAVKEVVLGCRADARLMREVASILSSGDFRHVKLFVAKEHESRYQLEFMEVGRTPADGTVDFSVVRAWEEGRHPQPLGPKPLDVPPLLRKVPGVQRSEEAPPLQAIKTEPLTAPPVTSNQQAVKPAARLVPPRRRLRVEGEE